MNVLGMVSIDGIRLEAAVHPAVSTGRAGTVVQVHGINTDMHEGGMFVRLAEQLTQADFTVLRFSFRGHGSSGGTQRGVTIAGELLDLQAVLEHARAYLPGPLSIVASSFGAVSTSLSLSWMGDRLTRLVTWNPVLDLRRTFVEPELPWGKENFGPHARELLCSQGFLVIDGEFQLGQVMFEEFRNYHPLNDFVASAVPSLIVHGNRDRSVSYDIARQAAAAKPHCAFHTVVNSDHGFDSREREDDAIAATVTWLTAAQVEPS